MITDKYFDKKLNSHSLIAVGHDLTLAACPMVFWLEQKEPLNHDKAEPCAYLSYYRNPGSGDHTRIVKQIITPQEADLRPLTDHDLIDFLKVGWMRFSNVDSAGKVEQIAPEFVNYHYERAINTTVEAT